MEVVPVIDLKSGVVVRARQGDRASYRPIVTPLSATSEPLDVVAGLLSVHPFRSLYVADLDAIEGHGDSAAVIEEIARAFPQLALWIDNGCSTMDAADSFLAHRTDPHPRSGGGGPPKAGEGANTSVAPVTRPLHHAPHGPPPPSTTGEGLLGGASLVLGSESQSDTALVEAFRNDELVILSLDFRGEQFLGPPKLLEDPGLWPSRVILMTLARVGSGGGPDFDRLAEIRPKADGRAIYLAGGLRGREDLPQARVSGAAGILVASAIHDGRLAAADLASLES